MDDPTRAPQLFVLPFWLPMFDPQLQLAVPRSTVSLAPRPKGTETRQLRERSEASIRVGAVIWPWLKIPYPQ